MNKEDNTLPAPSRDLQAKLRKYGQLAKAVKKPLTTATTALPLGAAFLLSAPVAEATVIHSGPLNQHLTQVNPENTTNSYILDFDINGGGADLRFRIKTFRRYNYFQVTLADAAVGFIGTIDTNLEFGFPFALSEGETISNGEQTRGYTSFDNTLAYSTAPGFNFGHWADMPSGTAKFMGFKLNDGTKDMYGWIRIQFNSMDDWTFLEWAYDDSGAPIATSSLLPVEISYFQATTRAAAARLAWGTLTESNNAGFEVERSEDGVHFRKIGWVDGRGSTAEPQEYYYDDKALRTDRTYYYRLKQIDFDGRFEYSKVISVTLEPEREQVGEIFPNPAPGGWVELPFTAKKEGRVDITVFDQSGREITRTQKAFSEGHQSLSLDLSHLSQGIYYVKLETVTDRYYRKLIIQ